MTEEQVFLAALDLPDSKHRSAYLDTVCRGDTEFRRQVEGLLAAHFKSGEFLNEPALQQLAGDSANSSYDETMYVSGNSEENAVANKADQDDEADDLHFLQPSTRADSLGRIGHYEVLEVLGKGGFGIVFRAFDDVLQRVVALKVLAPAMAATSPARKRFLREAQASARVRHENVVQVHAVEEQPLPYLVMEFIAGETLQQRLDRKGPIEVSEIVSLGRQIAEGLAAAHAMGLIHRDIKPGNILIEGGSSDRVKITDFGLARAADDASMTQSGVVAGTPMFMAPEQAQGEVLDQRADLFSLGSVLYVMTSGRPPFRAGTTFAVLKRVVEEAPRPITDLIPETPQWLCDIITKLHSKKPEDRFQSAREVADLLANCEAQLKEHSRLKDLSLIPRAKVQPELGWKWVVAALVLPLLAIGAYFATRPGSQPKVVERESKEPSKPDLKPVVVPTPDSVANQDPHPAIVPFNAAQARAHQKAWATHLGVPVEHTNSIGMQFVLIPPGEFMMGSPAAELEQILQGLAEDPNKDILEPRVRASAPQHRVMLTQPRYLGIHEVTQAQYEKVMGKNPAHFAATGAGKDAVAGMETTNHPVDRVSWLDAVGFCLELGKREKLKPCYLETDKSVTQQNGTGYRLPTEAEWEFACRAGSLTSYSTGDQESDLVRVGWFVANSNGRSHAAGELQANPFGLYDMHGNAWEWIQDWSDYAYYQQLPKSLVVDPLGPASSQTSERGLRGGMIGCAAFRCRSSNRDAYVPTEVGTDVGFRVSLTVEAVKAAMASPSTMAPSPEVQTPSLAQRIAALPAAEQIKAVREALQRLNPGFDGMLVTMIEYDLVTELSFNSDHVENIAPVRALAGLVYLDCRGTYPNKGILSDLSPLKGMKLSRLDCSSTQISDLTPLADMPLTWLQFNHNPVSDLTPLKKMPLDNLGCAETRVSDFSPLQGLKLRVLGAQLLAVTDLSPLEGMPLTGLDLYHTTGVTDLSPLKGMPLEGINLQDVPVSDLSPLKDMTTLRTLQLTGTAVTDLGPLQGLKLSDLIFEEKQISDLSPLKGMPLARLIIHGSGVTDLSPLQGMPLQEIRLTPKNITQGLDNLREIKGLKTIGIDGTSTWSPEEFWERYDKGEFKE